VDDLFRVAKDKFLVMTWDKFHRNRVLDLHHHSDHMARAAVRLALRALGAPVKAFIVGKGNNSGPEGPKLVRVVQEELAAQVPPIGSKVDSWNAGVLKVGSADVEAWVAALDARE
jgi:hypothetical protein